MTGISPALPVFCCKFSRGRYFENQCVWSAYCENKI